MRRACLVALMRQQLGMCSLPVQGRDRHGSVPPDLMATGCHCGFQAPHSRAPNGKVLCPPGNALCLRQHPVDHGFCICMWNTSLPGKFQQVCTSDPITHPADIQMMLSTRPFAER